MLKRQFKGLFDGDVSCNGETHGAVELLRTLQKEIKAIKDSGGKRIRIEFNAGEYENTSQAFGSISLGWVIPYDEKDSRYVLTEKADRDSYAFSRSMNE